MKKPGKEQAEKFYKVFVIIYVSVCLAIIFGNAFSAPEFQITAEKIEQTQEEVVEAFKEEDTEASEKEAAEVVEENKLININTATAEELMTLGGIGEVIAERIIEYRENNNGFLTVDELIEVKGIGESKLEKIRDYVTVGSDEPEPPPVDRFLPKL